MSDRQERLVQILFRLWSPFYDLPPAQALFYRPIHRKLLAAIGDVPARAVLDLGAGTGQLTADLRQRHPQALVVAADLSHQMLKQAGERAPTRVQANVYALPFADGAFDLVTSSISYHFYLEPQRALAQVRRVLGTGGRFALATMAPRQPGAWARLNARNMRFVTPDQIVRDLEEAGFRVDSVGRARLIAGVFLAVKR
jgi:ubiquinone/menaquinone biosynthesis C-methylase UbiE